MPVLIDGLAVTRGKNETQEEATVRVATERMRDPNAGLAQRLIATRVLEGRRGIAPELAESVKIHRAMLARQVRAEGPVRAGGETWYIDGDVLRSVVG